MRLGLATALWVTIAAFTLLALSEARGAAVTDHDPSRPPVMTGCVIRFYPTGPEIHENSAHACTFNSVETDTAGDLLIRMDGHGRVMWVGVNSDECLAKRDIFGGGSNGLGRVTVRFYRNGQHVRVDSSAIQGSSCNAWVGVMHEGVWSPTN